MIIKMRKLGQMSRTLLQKGRSRGRYFHLSMNSPITKVCQFDYHSIFVLKHNWDLRVIWETPRAPRFHPDFNTDHLSYSPEYLTNEWITSCDDWILLSIFHSTSELSMLTAPCSLDMKFFGNNQVISKQVKSKQRMQLVWSDISVISIGTKIKLRTANSASWEARKWSISCKACSAWRNPTHAQWWIKKPSIDSGRVRCTSQERHLRHELHHFAWNGNWWRCAVRAGTNGRGPLLGKKQFRSIPGSSS